MEYPKVLVISNNSFSLSNSNGRTLGLLFKGWPKDKLAQFCITTDGPDWDVCDHYFCASDRQVMKRTLTLRGVKRNDLKEYQTYISIPKTKRIKRTPIKSLVRHFMWRLGIWRRGDFDSWVADFSPEIVIIQSGDTAFTHDLARGIANQYQAKLVFFNTEGIYFLKENYLYKGFYDSIFFPLYHHIYKHSYRRAMQCASYAFYLNDLIKHDNDAVFDIPGRVIYNTSSLSPTPFVFNQDAPVISYFGNFGFDRSKALVEFAQVLSELNNNYKFHVYGRASTEDEVLFSSCKTIVFEGFIPYNKVIDIIQHSDLLVHVESRNPLYSENLRYGFSTKIADCLSSARPFVLFAPKDIACVQYVLDNNCAWFADSRDTLKTVLSELFSNADKREIVSLNARKVAMENHDLKINNSTFQTILIGLLVAS